MANPVHFLSSSLFYYDILVEFINILIENFMASIEGAMF